MSTNTHTHAPASTSEDLFVAYASLLPRITIPLAATPSALLVDRDEAIDVEITVDDDTLSPEPLEELELDR